MSTEKKTVDRRTIAKGAAWTLPVIATAAAAPAASASTNPNADVVVSHACGGLTIPVPLVGNVGVSFPTFTITAVEQGVDAGSTYTLRGAGLADISVGAPSTAIQIHVLSDSEATITVSTAIPAGGNVSFQILGIATVAVLTKFSLTLASETGNDNVNTTNDTASGFYTGIALAGGLIGACGSANAARKAEERKARRAGLI